MQQTWIPAGQALALDARNVGLQLPGDGFRDLLVGHTIQLLQSHRGAGTPLSTHLSPKRLMSTSMCCDSTAVAQGAASQVAE